MTTEPTPVSENDTGYLEYLYARVDADPADRGRRLTLAGALRAGGSPLADGHEALARCGMRAHRLGNDFRGRPRGLCFWNQSKYAGSGYPAATAADPFPRDPSPACDAGMVADDWYQLLRRADPQVVSDYQAGEANLYPTRRELENRLAGAFLGLSKARQAELLGREPAE